jgi:hypothetical protein
MKLLAIAASSLVLAALMVFTALGPRAQHAVQRAVRNAAHDWESPFPPLLKLGINFALNEVGVPMRSRHCAAPSLASDTMLSGLSVVFGTNADGQTNLHCPRPWEGTLSSEDQTRTVAANRRPLHRGSAPRVEIEATAVLPEPR